MEFFVGAGLAVVVVVFGRLAGLDRDRAFYPVMLIIIASYYELFAVMGGSVRALSIETLVFALFAFAAVVGFKRNLGLVAGALVAHGVFDFVRGDLISNPGVPAWWPMFCLTFDVVAGGYLAWLIIRGDKFGVHVRPHVDQELAAAVAIEAAGDVAAAFRYLERAHVLGQASTMEHVRVHVRMLVWALRQQKAAEALGQIMRIVGAATMTAFKAVPLGNTGGSNVSAFRSMPIPADLAAIIRSASTAVVSRVLSVVLIVGSLLAVGGCDGTPKDVRFATGEGRSIAYRVIGTGQPVVVMISGLGDGMASFKDVAPELAKSGTVIVYDRAGYGASGPAEASMDAVASDRDLSMMLAQSGVEAPYVLVGHSLGGLFAEYFAAKHPEQVAGMILEESRPADFVRRCEAADAGLCTPPALLAKFMIAGAQAEIAGLAATMDEVEAAKPVEGKAVLVLSRPVDDAKPFDRLWGQAQDDLAGRYRGARHLTAPGGGHYVHQDEKDWFVAAMRRFLADNDWLCPRAAAPQRRPTTPLSAQLLGLAHESGQGSDYLPSSILLSIQAVFS